MKCPKGMAWDTAKKKCVKVGPGQSITNPLNLLGIGKKEYSLKGGVDWFGEDASSSKPSGNMMKGAKKAASELASKIKKKKKGKN